MLGMAGGPYMSAYYSSGGEEESYTYIYLLYVILTFEG